MAEKETETTSKKLSSFLDKNKKVVICLLCVVVVAVAAIVCCDVIVGAQANKNIAKIDAITFALIDGSSELDEAELNAKRNSTMDELAAFTKKAGVVGVRANMVCAELAFQKEDYAASLAYWNATAAKGKKAYTAPVAYYNAGVCCEKLNKIDEAAENYKKAASGDFILKNHAKFSYARVLETLGKYNEAVAAYTELNDSNPEDTWAKLAKTRIITLQAQGKTE